MPESSTLHPDTPREQWDVIVVGGGPAGFSAALMLGRARRRVLVVDAGEPRNRFAAHMHGVLGHEGLEPAELLRRGREEVRGYGVEVRAGSVTGIHDDNDDDNGGASGSVGPSGLPSPSVRLLVTFADAPPAYARSVILASGQTDALPDIPGLREFWGTGVLHCPYCHGWEVRGRRLAVLGTSPMSLHQVQLVRQWSDQLVFLTVGLDRPDTELAERLRARGVAIEDSPVERVLSERDQDGRDRLSGVRLTDGRELELDAIFVAPEARPHDSVVSGLALEQTTSPMGTVPETDFTGRTSHPRVWAVGNVANPGATVPVSMAAGSMAGGMVNMMLVEEEFDAATAQSVTAHDPAQPATEQSATAADPTQPAAYWETRYSEQGHRWSGAVNATTAAVASTLPAPPDGRALDLGCGEGADAIWLAEQGWRVTAVDISATAVERGAEAAAERGLGDRLNWVVHDLASWSTDERFDLVTVSFFHSEVDLPRIDILRRAAEWIRPGGHLLLVTHVFESEADIPPWGRRPATGDAHSADRGHNGHGRGHGHGHGHGPGHHHDSGSGQAAHHGSHPQLPTPAEERAALALDPGEWDLVSEEIRPREVTGPDGSQTATLKDGVLLLRRRG